jgi:type II secretory pathway component GspD/PulD (secretin)
LGVQDSVLFDRSTIDDVVTVTETMFNAVGLPIATTERIISQSADPGFAFNNQPLGTNPAINTSAVGGQGLSNFGLGRVSSDLGYGGLVLSAGSESVSVLVRALAARRKLNVLSRPQIRTLDNQPAMIQVGQQVPIVDGVAVTGTGSANPVVRQDQAGIILSVTPRISPDEVIVMEVSAEKSQYTGAGVPLFTDANTGNVIESPVKDVITARTTVSIPNGQTVVLGGMITTLDDVTERKVPWLGDLPIVGHAFRTDIERTRRTELLIFLTPRVIHNSLDSEMIKQVEAARMHYVECAAEEVHGPLFGVPEETGLYAPVSPSALPQVRDESPRPPAVISTP